MTKTVFLSFIIEIFMIYQFNADRQSCRYQEMIELQKFFDKIHNRLYIVIVGCQYSLCNRIDTLQVFVKFDKMWDDKFGKIVG